MTRIQTIPHNFLGFDDIFRELNRPTRDTTFPPYNIVEEADNKSRIEIAVAGYSNDEIDVTHQEDSLTIQGEKNIDENTKYLHKGIAGRSFKRVFRLHNEIEVKGAELTNGLLNISLERIVPKEKQPKTIKIK